MDEITANELRPIIQLALREDVGAGDVTTLATVPQQAISRARVVAREPLTVSGLGVAEAVWRELSQSLVFTRFAEDGRSVTAGDALLHLQGNARAILTGERVALNFLQRLSGVATLTAKYVNAIAGTQASILDTRKTTPGWRLLEKYAVRCGGGKNHRLGLFDRVLIKDNHLAALREELPNAIAAAVRRARETFPELKVEVEADTAAQVQEALEAGADIVLLDNMDLDTMSQAVQHTRGRAQTEASGGVTLQTVRAIAETGVDFISVGALTHSARAVDIALDFE